MSMIWWLKCQVNGSFIFISLTIHFSVESSKVVLISSEEADNISRPVNMEEDDDMKTEIEELFPEGVLFTLGFVYVGMFCFLFNNFC